MEAHCVSVANIVSQVSAFHQRQTPFRLYHGSTNSTQARKVDPNRMIDTTNLNNVLKVDTASKICLVEPNVPMDQLVDATLACGLIPPVVMEFPGITVGGGFAGTAGESSGFRYGFFESTINWIEIVLPNGEVVTASTVERSDLFYGASGSLGTFGVTTMLEIRLIEAKRYVELTYHPTESVADALETMQLATKDEANDFVDGILFSPEKGVIITGKLTNEVLPPAYVQRFTRAHDPWFYVHAESVTRRTFGPEKETTPIRDYLFRYDRGAFWTGKYAYKYFLTPFNRVTRWALDYFMRSRVMYHALHASGHASKYMIQDILLPYETAEDFIQYVDTRFNIWPLWLCPFVVDGQLPLHPNLGHTVTESSAVFINVGVWAPGSNKYALFVENNRRLERKVRELGGVKWLYAQAYYTEDEFWSIYDRKWYDELREKYHATYLPTVYEKIRVGLPKTPLTNRLGLYGWLRSLVWNIWPVSGVYGVVKTLYEREYLLAA